MLRTEKYQVAVNNTIKIWRNIGKEVMANLVNFADFGIFPSQVLKHFKFDETFFNGKEDYELVVRLKKVGISVEAFDFNLASVGSGTFSKVNPSLVKEVLNSIYFGAKMREFGFN